MSVPAVPAPVPSVPDDHGRRLARRSLLMLPMLLFSAAVAAFFGFYMLGRHDLEGSEPMSVQGGFGWMVWAISTALLLTPTLAGVVLGFRARRRGGGRPALAGLLINGVILVGYPILSFVNLLGQ